MKHCPINPSEEQTMVMKNERFETAKILKPVISQTREESKKISVLFFTGQNTHKGIDAKLVLIILADDQNIHI